VAHTLILHVENSEPIVGESDELPSAGDTLVQLRNPRRQDGRDLHYLAENSVMLYWPVHKLISSKWLLHQQMKKLSDSSGSRR
jgi:hypothetical protein